MSKWNLHVLMVTAPVWSIVKLLLKHSKTIGYRDSFTPTAPAVLGLVQGLC